MSLFLFNPFPSPLPTKLTCNFNRHTSQPLSNSPPTIPARDRIIDFGKHTGNMLGTLPSKYLKWVSKNLRARDFEHWAKLADQVLQDPVYKDRIEWEFAQNILTGDNTRAESDCSVDEFLEFSQRFGWDNDDKLGWSRIDFSLLGTSRGGRIPRKGDSKSVKIESLSESCRILSSRENKLGGLNLKEGGEVPSVGGKREARVEKQRLKRGLKLNNLEEKSDLDFLEAKQEMVNKTSNPFPGRQALLKKVFDSRRRVL